jgi:hypothetical protein
MVNFQKIHRGLWLRSDFSHRRRAWFTVKQLFLKKLEKALAPLGLACRMRTSLRGSSEAKSQPKRRFDP